jgi:hypothetical protein
MPRHELICADSSAWVGEADVVFTHPYAPIPACLRDKPMILNLYERDGSRQALAEGWIGGRRLHPIGRWGNGLTNRVYVTGLPVAPIRIWDLVEDPPIFMPLELPLRLLGFYDDLIQPGMTVWDGFCARATIGLACENLGLGYVGIDHDPSMIGLAREYLGC